LRSQKGAVKNQAAQLSI